MRCHHVRERIVVGVSWSERSVTGRRGKHHEKWLAICSLLFEKRFRFPILLKSDTNTINTQNTHTKTVLKKCNSVDFTVYTDIGYTYRPVSQMADASDLLNRSATTYLRTTEMEPALLFQKHQTMLVYS
jgi:hypothetical protein